MAKLTLNTIGSRYGSVEALNDNFDAIEQALENTFSLDGTSPNALEADLDMNNNDILNVKNIIASSLLINNLPVEPTTLLTTGSVFQTYEFTAIEGQTIFSIDPSTPLVTSLIVIVNGLQLSPSEISVFGTNVLTPAMKAGDEVIIRRFTSDPVPAPDASNINFIQAGTGAVTRTSQNKMRDIVSVKDFGAVGDGIADESAAFQLAVNAVQALGGGTVFIPAGRYKIKSQIDITSNNVSIKGQGKGSVIDCSELNYYTEFSSLDINYASASYYRKSAFAIKGSFVKEVYLNTASMPVTENQATLTLVAGGTSDIQVGDCCFLRSKQHWYGVGERFALSKIISVNAGANTVNLMEGVPLQFDSSGTVRTWVADPTPGTTYEEWGGYYTWPTAATDTRLVVWRPIKNFEISDLTVEGGGLSFTAVGFGPGLDGVSTQTITSSSVIKNGAGQVFVYAQYVENVVVNNISVTKGFRGIVVSTMYSNDVSVTNSFFRGLPDNTFIPTENVNSGWYSMYFSQGRDLIVSGNIFNRVRHGPDGSECFNFTQTNNVAYRTFKAAFGSHQEVYNLTLTGNTSYNCYAFAVLRAKDANVIGNSIYASNSSVQPTWGYNGITTGVHTQNSDDLGNFVISGNTFISNATIPNGIIAINAGTKLCNITNNVISLRGGNAIRLLGGSTINATIANNNILFTNVNEADYTGATAYTNPTSGIIIDPYTVTSNYAAYLGDTVLTPLIDSILIKGNIIEGYGGTTALPGTGNAIAIYAPINSYQNPVKNILITENVGKPKLEDSSFMVRLYVNPPEAIPLISNPATIINYSGGYFGKNITVSKNSIYGDASAVYGISSTDEYAFYESPIVLHNIGQTDAQKTHLVIGNYSELGNCTTVIKGCILNNIQPAIGEPSQYIVTTSGTTGSLAGGITASTTSGSPTVTLTGNSFGDTYVVPGSYISIAGANTGVRVIAVSANYATITLESNATATVAGAAVTRYNPVFSSVSSPVGNVVPQNSKSTNYTTVLADSGSHLYTTTGGITFTIAANSSVAYPVGTALTFVNAASANITVAISTDTMTLAGTTTTGSRTLAQNGVATALKVGTTSWLISGTGLT